MSLRAIRELTEECLALFKQHVADSASIHHQKAEQYLNSFVIWISYTGALARGRTSLDERLKDADSVTLAVLELLSVVQTCLSNEPSGNVSCSLKADEFLEALDAAVDSLHKLAVAIRRCSAPNSKFRLAGSSKDDGMYEPYFETIVKTLVRTKFPHARKSLCDHIGASIAYRRKRILYQMRHNKKLEPPPVTPDTLPASETLPEDVTNQKPAVIRAKFTQPPNVTFNLNEPSSTSASAPNKSLFEKLRNAPTRTVMSIRLGASVQNHDVTYPQIPTSTSTMVQCPYCGEPISTNLLEGPASEKYWRQHIDRDLQPYTCISERCQFPLQFFTHSTDWVKHMTAKHMPNWKQIVHGNTWICDFSHSDTLTFQCSEEFEAHLTQNHQPRPSKAQCAALIRSKKATAIRDSSFCPLCEAPVEEPAHGSHVGPLSYLDDHIADHLKYLAFFSLPNLDPGPCGQEDEESEMVVSLGESSYKKESDRVRGRDVGELASIDLTFGDVNDQVESLLSEVAYESESPYPPQLELSAIQPRLSTNVVRRLHEMARAVRDQSERKTRTISQHLQSANEISQKMLTKSSPSLLSPAITTKSHRWVQDARDRLVESNQALARSSMIIDDSPESVIKAFHSLQDGLPEKFVACPFAKTDPDRWLTNCGRSTMANLRNFLRCHVIGKHRIDNRNLLHTDQHKDAMDDRLFLELISMLADTKIPFAEGGIWHLQEQSVQAWYNAQRIIAKWLQIDTTPDQDLEWTNEWVREVYSRKSAPGVVTALTEAVRSLRNVISTTLASEASAFIKLDPILAGLSKKSDDFSFINSTFVTWNQANVSLRTELDRERNERQLNHDISVHELFEDKKLGYSDIDATDAKFNLDEADRRYQEDQKELESFVKDVYDKVTTRLEAELTELKGLQVDAVALLEDSIVSVSAWLQIVSEGGQPKVPTTELVDILLQLYTKIELRHKQIAEVQFERERRRKRLELSVLYNNRDDMTVKRLEKEFSEAHLRVVFEEACRMNERANVLTDTLDIVTTRGLARNQAWIHDVQSRMQLVRDLVASDDHRAIGDKERDVLFYGVDGIREIMSQTQSDLNLVLSDSQKIVNLCNAIEVVLNEADYAMYLAELNLAHSSPEEFERLKQDKIKEDEKIRLDFEERLEVAVVKAPLDLVTLMREVNKGLVGSDEGHSKRIGKALEDAKKRNKRHSEDTLFQIRS